eukprot:Nk52_evm4s462 gene=Nk52_evmTU4s462
MMQSTSEEDEEEQSIKKSSSTRPNQPKLHHHLQPCNEPASPHQRHQEEGEERTTTTTTTGRRRPRRKDPPIGVEMVNINVLNQQESLESMTLDSNNSVIDQNPNNQRDGEGSLGKDASWLMRIKQFLKTLMYEIGLNTGRLVSFITGLVLLGVYLGVIILAVVHNNHHPSWWRRWSPAEGFSTISGLSVQKEMTSTWSYHHHHHLSSSSSLSMGDQSGHRVELPEALYTQHYGNLSESGVLGNERRQRLRSECKIGISNVPFNKGTGFYEMDFEEFVLTFKHPPSVQSSFPFFYHRDTRQPMFNCSLSRHVSFVFNNTVPMENYVNKKETKSTWDEIKVETESGRYETVTVPHDYEIPWEEDRRVRVVVQNTSVFYFHSEDDHHSDWFKMENWAPVEALESFFHMAPLSRFSRNVRHLPVDLREDISTFHVTDTAFGRYWMYYSCVRRKGRDCHRGGNGEKETRRTNRLSLFFDASLRVYLDCGSAITVGSSCFQITLKNGEFPKGRDPTKIASKESHILSFENGENLLSLSSYELGVPSWKEHLPSDDFWERVVNGKFERPGFRVSGNIDAITRTGAAESNQLAYFDLSDFSSNDVVWNVLPAEERQRRSTGWSWSGQMTSVEDFGSTGVIKCTLESLVRSVLFVFQKNCVGMDVVAELISKKKEKTTVSVVDKFVRVVVYPEKDFCSVSFFSVMPWKCLYLITTDTSPEESYLDSFVDENSVNDDIDDDWKLIFSDEFNGSMLDPTKWKAESGPSLLTFDTAHVLNVVQNMTMLRKDNAMVRGGLLRIVGGRSESEYPFQSAIVSSADRLRFLYGRVDIRARITAYSSLPVEEARTQDGKDSLPVNGSNIYGFEWFLRAMDNLDTSVSNSQLYGLATNRSFIALAQFCRRLSVQNYFVDGKNRMFDRHYPDNITDVSQFHNYSVVWSPFKISYFVNGVRIAVSERDSYQSMNIELGMIVGGGMGQTEQTCSWCKKDPLIRRLNETISTLENPSQCVDDFITCRKNYTDVEKAFQAYAGALTKNTLVMEVDSVRVYQNISGESPYRFKGYAHKVSNLANFADTSTPAEARTRNSVYKLVFSDEFTRGSVDTARWSVANERPLDMGVVPEQAYFAPKLVGSPYGKLVLRAQHNHDFGLYEGYPFVGGRVSTRQSFAFSRGYVEVSAKLSPLCGTVSAIWLLFCHQDPFAFPCSEWPPEIDLVEYTKWGKNKEELFSTYHIESAMRTGDGQATDMPLLGLDSSFHIFALNWTETKVEFQVDGVVYKTVSNGKYKGRTIEDRKKNITVTEKPMHLIMNLGVGGGILIKHSLTCPFVQMYSRAKKYAERAPNGIWCLGDRRMCSQTSAEFRQAISLMDESALKHAEQNTSMNGPMKSVSGYKKFTQTYHDEDEFLQRDNRKLTKGSQDVVRVFVNDEYAMEVDYVRVYQTNNSTKPYASWSRLVSFGNV